MQFFVALHADQSHWTGSAMTFAAAKSQRASLGIKVAKPEGIGVC
jgi:hypothetical protein